MAPLINLRGKRGGRIDSKNRVTNHGVILGQLPLYFSFQLILVTCYS
jgi:hypothetical protein